MLISCDQLVLGPIEIVIKFFWIYSTGLIQIPMKAFKEVILNLLSGFITVWGGME